MAQSSLLLRRKGRQSALFTLNSCFRAQLILEIVDICSLDYLGSCEEPTDEQGTAEGQAGTRFLIVIEFNTFSTCVKRIHLVITFISQVH
jgi:hypothetical protein